MAEIVRSVCPDVFRDGVNVDVQPYCAGHQFVDQRFAVKPSTANRLYGDCQFLLLRDLPRFGSFTKNFLAEVL